MEVDPFHSTCVNYFIDFFHLRTPQKRDTARETHEHFSHTTNLFKLQINAICVILRKFGHARTHIALICATHTMREVKRENDFQESSKQILFRVISAEVHCDSEPRSQENVRFVFLFLNAHIVHILFEFNLCRIYVQTFKNNNFSICFLFILIFFFRK